MQISYVPTLPMYMLNYTPISPFAPRVYNMCF